MGFQFEETGFKGLYVVKPPVFKDLRGYFSESYNNRELKNITDAAFVQDNVSMSMKNVLRGLHFQVPPMGQDKLVRVITGRALDVVVDIRKNEPTYGKSYTVELSADNFLQLFIPQGFAHGFVTLEDNTIFSYKSSNYYAPEMEGGLSWNDPQFQINRNVTNPNISEKDTKYQPFEKFISPF